MSPGLSSEAGSDGEKEVKSERKVSKEEKPVMNGTQLDPLKISNGHNAGDVSSLCVTILMENGSSL